MILSSCEGKRNGESKLLSPFLQAPFVCLTYWQDGGKTGIVKLDD